MLSLHMQGFFVDVGILIILGWSIYIPLRAGQMYNGPVFCMAIAAYFAAYSTRDLGWSVMFGSIAGILVSSIIAFLLSFPLARVSGFAMAVATISLTFIVQTIIRNLEFLGGAAGFSFYPEMPFILPITYLLVFAIMFFLYRMSNSRFGRAMELTDFDRELAGALGVNTKKMSILLQTFSGVLGGTAGVLYAFNIGTLFPEIFSFNLLIYGFSIVMVGGRATMWGVLIFAPILWGIPEFSPDIIGQWRNIFFASIIIALLVLRPEGVINKRFIRKIGINLKVS